MFNIVITITSHSRAKSTVFANNHTLPKSTAHSPAAACSNLFCHQPVWLQEKSSIRDRDFN